MKKPAGSSNQLRIIGGQWRSRRIRFADAAGLRPTPDRVRETVFNWLQAEVPGAHCLDLFAGSGAMGFEALSRGAASAVLVERDAAQLACLQQSVEVLRADNCRVVAGDAIRLLETAALPLPEQGFDIVFMDPPFHKGLLPRACQALLQAGLLHEGSWVYLETESDWEALALGNAFERFRETRAGLVNSFLTRYHTS